MPEIDIAIPHPTGPLSERAAGVCAHLTSLPGAFGIGGLGAGTHAFVDTLAAMEIGVWQFLPTGPTAYGDSPYQPLSSFAGNEMLIDIDGLIALGLVKDSECESLRRLPEHYVDYGALIPQKIAVLRLAASRFARVASAAMRMDYATFLSANDARWLHDYAMYRVLKSHHEERSWPEWPAPFVRRDPHAMAQFAADQSAQVEAIKVSQFLFFEQWQALRAHARRRNVRLFGDMPIYIALDSSDAWANPQLLQIDRDGQPQFVAGVPPDYFSADGQRWGNPLYDWRYHADSGYAWWIDRVRHCNDQMDLLRIDHFRGFESYWAIPASSPTARDGAWQPGPGDAIFDALRNALGDLPIVAEDLGIITPEVEALRDRQGLPGMRVLHFEVGNKAFDIDAITQNRVCYTATHDNDTTVGWFHGSAADSRSEDEIRLIQQRVLRVTGGKAATIHLDLIKLAFASKARLAVAPLQDLIGLGSDARLNTPGSSGNNWSWRFVDAQLTSERREWVRSAVRASGRVLVNSASKSA